MGAYAFEYNDQYTAVYLMLFSIFLDETDFRSNLQNGVLYRVYDTQKQKKYKPLLKTVAEKLLPT